MSPFDFEDYKLFIRERIRAMPKQGRGQLLRLAEHLRIPSSNLSLVLKGERDFTPDQLCAAAKFLDASPLETEYLLALLQFARADSPDLKALTQNRLRKIRTEAMTQNPGTSVSSSGEAKPHPMDELQKSTFYSSCYYSAVHLATFIPKLRTPEAIAAAFRLPKTLVMQCLDFLVVSKMCIEKNGRFEPGTLSTVLAAQSPLATNYMQNWRIRGLDRLPLRKPPEYFFSCPLVLSEKDVEKVRNLLRSVATEIKKVSEESDAEKLVCVNIDLFDF